MSPAVLLPVCTPVPAWPQVRVAGIRISALRQDDLLILTAHAIAGRLPPVTVATVNLAILRQMDADPAVARTIAGFPHRVADGWPLLLLAWLAGHALPGRVTGSDYAAALLPLAAREGWRVACVGGTGACRDALRKTMRRRWGLVAAGHWLPQVDHQRAADPATNAAIRASGAQVLLVALGCPKQERWLAANAVASGVRFAIGVGGSLDFLAGVQRRAPRWMRRLCLEWLFRCLCQPRRLAGRYLRDAWFLLRLLCSPGRAPP